MRMYLSLTLFPYTTLFRSGVTSTDVTGMSVTVIDAVALFPSLVAVIVAEPGVTPDTSPEVLTVATSEGKSADRKSTRLNSSHRCISYAVFCLKKKKYIVLI